MTTAPQDLDGLIGTLDLAAKVRLLTGATSFTLPPAESIGLREVRLSDGPTGVRGLKFTGGRQVALFPNATLLAAGWSEQTAYEVGGLLAEEALAQDIHVVLGPTINLHRSLLGGRVFEAYSEDPLLTGKLAAAYVRGLQDRGIGGCLKHLVANESETERNTVDSVVDEATLRELYLLPFEIAVAESDPWSIMAAYNDVNGVPATEQDAVINGIVKGEWGYDGLLMSDWYATKTAGPAANGGLDLVMPGPDGPWGAALVAAVRRGEVTESVVDDHLRRVLRLASRVGALGAARPVPADLPAPDGPVRREQLTRLAASGMTVLTNRDEVLPLARTARVALIGRHAVDTVDMGGGSAQVNPPYQTSVAEGLTALLGSAVTVTDGVEVRSRPVPAAAGFVTDPVTGAPGIRVTLYAADGSVIQDRHSDIATAMVGFDDDFTETVATVRLRAVVESAGPVEIGVLGVGDWSVRVGDAVTRHQLAVSGGGFGEELLLPPATVGTYETAGLVEATVPAPATGDSPLSGAGLFGLVARPARRPEAEVLAEAVAAAAAADVAVVVVGLTEEQETEAVDKTTLRLPGAQDALVAAAAAAARRTVVVLNAATPVLMPWLPSVDAVLWAGLPGQEGGHAVAAALLGDIEPAGRLVSTFPVADGAAPAWSVTPVDGAVVYTEGTFIGHRGHFAGHAPAPAFWFGHGLGYSSWEYGPASLLDRTTVSVAVTNTGTRASREVVQVYLVPAGADQPVRLVGWAAAAAEPGGTVEVRVDTDPRLWRRWDAAAGRWDRLPAGGQLLVARGLGDIRATLPL
ncbi:MAG: glycoside hydrolase family 3 C-terminal domain-containing protein [Mycobacteriales bacterium]